MSSFAASLDMPGRNRKIRAHSRSFAVQKSYPVFVSFRVFRGQKIRVPGFVFRVEDSRNHGQALIYSPRRKRRGYIARLVPIRVHSWLLQRVGIARGGARCPQRAGSGQSLEKRLGDKPLHLGTLRFRALPCRPWPKFKFRVPCSGLKIPILRAVSVAATRPNSRPFA